jgi:hypothetical protein
MCQLKECFKCKTVKPLTEFYKHSAMGDGHLGKCKECTKKDVNKHRLENLEKIRQYDRDRSKNPHRIKLALETNRKWRKEDKRRSNSHNAVARALKKGEIVKMNCIVCGSEKSMAHHESYDRPLDVVWYCQIHHKERHKQMAILGIET